MKIKRLGIPNYHIYNASFNKSTSPLVGEIFGTQATGPIGYMPPGKITLLPRGCYAPMQQAGTVESEQVPPSAQLSRFNLAGLGEYERVVFSCLAWGEYSTYVLTGEMGSGKTTIANFVMDVLRLPRNNGCGQCAQCSGPILISIDFNKGFSASETPKITRIFKRLLYARLKAELRQHFQRDSLTDKFLEYIQRRENLNDFSVFDDFAQACEMPEWLDQTEETKANALFLYVYDHSEDLDEQLQLLMLLVAFVRSTTRPDRACFVLLLDNIDVVSPEAQFDLLLIVLNLQEFSRIKTLVPMRRSTFERFNNQAAYSFGIINHTGPRPIEIVKARIAHYLKVWQEDPAVRALEPQHGDALRRRLQYLASEADKKNSALDRIFWLSGASLRQSLFMFERVVNNSVIEFDKDPHNRDEVLRAVLHGDNPDEDISSSDRFTVNLFVDPSSEHFSLICLRILQFVYEFSEHPNYRNVRNLVATLAGINGDWNTKAVQRALNYLLHTKRPLLWVDGKSIYDTTAQMIDCNDRIYITEAGGSYLSKLAMDLQYFQEASVGLEWKIGDNLPESLSYTSLLERIALVRLCLRAVMKQDLEETIRFQKWLNARPDYPKVRLKLFSSRMLLSIGESVLNILASAQGHQGLEYQGELKTWLSMVIEGFNSELSITSQRNALLDKLRRRYVAVISAG